VARGVGASSFIEHPRASAPVEPEVAETFERMTVRPAYRRGDRREKRRRLMADWAAYCESPPAATKGNVVPLRA